MAADPAWLSGKTAELTCTIVSQWYSWFVPFLLRVDSRLIIFLLTWGVIIWVACHRYLICRSKPPDSKILVKVRGAGTCIVYVIVICLLSQTVIVKT